MRLALLSDLHLAPPGTNRCGTDPAALLRLLERLGSSTDQILTVGDLFDLSRPRLPWGWREQLGRIERAWPELTRALLGFDGVYGNHDAPRRHLGVPERLERRSALGPFLMTHGHQADVGIKRIPGLPEVANFAAGWFVRARLDAGADWLEDVPRQLEALRPRTSSGQGRGPQNPTALWARRLLRQRGGVVVMGHVHRPRLVVGRCGLYINTGAHAQGHASHVILDLGRGEVELWSHGARVAWGGYDGVRWSVRGAWPFAWTWDEEES